MSLELFFLHAAQTLLGLYSVNAKIQQSQKSIILFNKVHVILTLPPHFLTKASWYCFATSSERSLRSHGSTSIGRRYLLITTTAANKRKPSSNLLRSIAVLSFKISFISKCVSLLWKRQTFLRNQGKSIYSVLQYDEGGRNEENNNIGSMKFTPALLLAFQILSCSLLARNFLPPLPSLLFVLHFNQKIINIYWMFIGLMTTLEFQNMQLDSVMHLHVSMQ